jgi:hypothetical protein
LVLEVGTDIRFCMLLKGLDLVEEARSFLILHQNRGITTIVNNPESIPIRLSTVRHKSLELGLRDIVLCHYIIQVLSKYTLSSIIL